MKLFVDASGRTARRMNAVLEELTKHGLGIRLGADAPHPSLVVANDGGRVGGAHASVRTKPDAEPAEASEWVPLLPRMPAGAPSLG